MNQKAISPVVATALLLVVAVVSVVSFQGWFQTFSSQVFTETESQNKVSSSNIANIQGDNLYINNQGNTNISIKSVQVDGNDCEVTRNISRGISDISLDNCLENASGNTEVVVVTDKGVKTKNFYVSGPESSTSSTGVLESSCPDNYVAIPGGYDVEEDGNTEQGFCLMKYEARNVSGVATAQPGGEPWVNITQNEARNACNALGENYSLVTNKQWMQAAKIIANTSENWNTSTAGEGAMMTGHSDSNPSDVLTASSDDTQGYYLTNDGSGSLQRRTFHIQDGILGNDPNVSDSYQGTVWDLSGNAWEWLNGTIVCGGSFTCDDMPGASTWSELPQVSDPGSLNTVELLRPNDRWNSSERIGRITVAMGPSFSSSYGFLRGAFYNVGTGNEGLFAILLDEEPSTERGFIGFRCSYQP